MRVFSGIQPSGELHVGNYLGAVRNWVALQDQYQCIFCIVDYHAITQEYEATALAERTFDMAVSLLAAGIDPQRSVLFVQSHVAEHTELAWVFTTVTPLGELERMTQFKDKAQRQVSVPAGLLNYPVLQAADVLLYRAQRVPVGEDQVQHIELMRGVARKWNARYGDGFFPEPEPVLTPAGRIVGLDGQAKMSKSLGNTIGILEGPEQIWERLRPAVTDPARVTRKDPGNPEVCNVYALHQHFSPSATVEEVAAKCRAAAWGCLDCKRVLAANITREFAPIRERAAALQAAPEQVREILHDGAQRARSLAAETMSEVRERMGFLSAEGAARPR
ncbi:MAG: tryptophan--tRNA ligase [Gemmatimonadota bacterium]|nr:tryptophan--tRNA ligase [Gemmatimonadota bacterium]MDH3366642.1 tryptophan--tRNA ligase [Gemmatimonadota bacterium]MDH3477251.1 tryptophan--tRNA ligase [Gemmatimonadota bacterium]MDH3570396.1 tryptophan--tRNA ligase [Gemmatimonadota bacterium]MDH5549981.1 tryptophan--tRNA ligase [Gemmatimonadota bacterium]